MFEQVNELAVLVSAILAVAVGSIWYSPLLFGPLWMKTIGQEIEGELSKREMILASVKSILAHVIFFLVVTQFIQISTIASIPLTTIGGLLLAFLSVSTLSLAIWEKRPIPYVLVHTGYNAIIIFGGIGIIAYWPW